MARDDFTKDELQTLLSLMSTEIDADLICQHAHTRCGFYLPRSFSLRCLC
jgi:hypothetical protein